MAITKAWGVPVVVTVGFGYTGPAAAPYGEAALALPSGAGVLLTRSGTVSLPLSPATVRYHLVIELPTSGTIAGRTYDVWAAFWRDSTKRDLLYVRRGTGGGQIPEGQVIVV